jgi:hypothetical protein
MVMVMATKESESGVPPKPEEFAAMQKYNEELAKAGIRDGPSGWPPRSLVCEAESRIVRPLGGVPRHQHSIPGPHRVGTR